MTNTGYVDYKNIEFVYYEEKDGIFLVPKNKDDIDNIRNCFDDKEFVFRYSSNIGESTAFIERVQYEFNSALKLVPLYIVKDCNTDLFSGFEIMGDAIDDFFNPSRFFYNRLTERVEANINYLYDSEIIEKWTVSYEGKNIDIELLYGGILRWGIASDLKLHPRLRIHFGATTDIQYVYRIYLIIVRFLQTIRYDSRYGNLRVDLFCEKDGKYSYNGCLKEWNNKQEQYIRECGDVEFSSYKQYIQLFLQFAAGNPDYSVLHYPTEGIRFLGRHYSVIDYINIFGAFECECRLKDELYEAADVIPISDIKEKLLAIIDEYPKTGLKNEELNFLNNAQNRISQLGTQVGQTQKIINAYNVLRGALESSINNIFYLPEFKLSSPLQESELRKVADFLARKRGAIAHGGFVGAFSDLDAQKIRFLEILTYAQLLKRIGLEDKDIERVIGARFGCNYVLFQEKHNSVKY